MKVGFIGLGNMGAAMAGNLLKASHELSVYNRTPAKAQALVQQGARLAATVAEACRRADVVVTMLADDPALESIAFGDEGAITALPPGGIHVSASTISVALSERLTAAHNEKGQHFVSAPVFGRPEAAAAAKLFIVAAGDSAAIDNCGPLFDAMGQRTFRFGEKPSNANLVKLSGNFLIMSVIESLSEAFALVAKGGLNQSEYFEFLTSTLFNAPVYKTYGKLVVEKNFEPAGFVASLGLKDVRLMLAAAESLRVSLPVADIVRNRFLTLLANGGGALDWSAISQLAAKDAGL